MNKITLDEFKYEAMRGETMKIRSPDHYADLTITPGGLWTISFTKSVKKVTNK